MPLLTPKTWLSFAEGKLTLWEVLGFKRADANSYPKTRILSVAFWMGAAIFLGWWAQYLWSNETGLTYFAPAAVAIFATCLGYCAIGGVAPMVEACLIEKGNPMPLVTTGIFKEATWSLFARAKPHLAPIFMENTLVHPVPLVPIIDAVLMDAPMDNTVRGWVNSSLHFIGLHAPSSHEEHLAYHRNLCKGAALAVHAIFCTGMLVVWILVLDISSTPSSDYARLTRSMARLRSVTVTWVVVAPTVTGGLLDLIHTYREDPEHKALRSRAFYVTWSLLLRTLLALLIAVVLDPTTDLIWNHEKPQQSELVVICVLAGVMLLALLVFWGSYAVATDGHHDRLFAFLDWPSTLSLLVYAAWCFVARVRDNQTVSVADQAMTSYFLLQATFAITTTIGARGIPSHIDHSHDTEPTDLQEISLTPAVHGNLGASTEPEDPDQLRMVGRFRAGNAWRMGRYARTATEDPSGPRSLVAQAM